MSNYAKNPYPPGTPEYAIWARWHRAFFDQPIHGQLLAIESDLRQTLSSLLDLTAQLDASAMRCNLQTRLVEMEASINLLEEMSEHAFVRIVMREPAAPSA